ncbi:hypothetical protein ACNQFN_14800 [Thauera butanivorans]|uniref:hypothetical protein n=1 Tax=Thauera butanivorans TaxID=86174 RepID=UPI003AB512C2
MTTPNPEQHNARRQPGEVGKSSATTIQFYTGNARELRLFLALAAGPVTREELDRRIGASNTPDLVFRLRQRGFDLPCELRAATDRDGNPVRYGIYRMTAADRRRVCHLLARRNNAGFIRPELAGLLTVLAAPVATVLAVLARFFGWA